MRHKQAKIDGIKVDVNIASLIQSLWNANIIHMGLVRKNIQEELG